MAFCVWRCGYRYRCPSHCRRRHHRRRCCLAVNTDMILAAASGASWPKRIRQNDVKQSDISI